ncbi:MAG TPA: hypothetical protein DD671_03805, partial [Balneolaceae bacterium]|nr:hypothetical protein [Balneolaceae bacterium]
MDQEILSKKQIKEIYSDWADRYDLSLWLFNLIGFQYQFYRREAIKGLSLKLGDTVIDLGCGTGLNFSILQRMVGYKGTIIGVDLSESMLDKAQTRVRRHGWKNVQLVESDMADFAIPEHTDAVLSTAALTMSPEYDQIIQYVANTLQAGKRMSIFEFKKPEKWPEWLVDVTLSLLKTYGVRKAHAKRTPWKS